MGDAAIVMEWGMPRQGREQKALEVFFSAVAQWEQWKSAGRIESYQTFGLLSGNQEVRSGMVIVQGSHHQMDDLMQAEDYRQMLIRVVTIGTNVSVSTCETGDAMTKRMQRYGTTLKGMGV